MTFRPRRIIAGSIAAALALGGAIFASTAEAATPTMVFSFIQYDSPGSDNRSNASRNAEYLRITNKGESNNLLNWTIVDAAGHLYRFPAHPIGKGKTVYVHTGNGADGINPFTMQPDSPRLFWNSGNYIWNNDGDSATLRSASGRVYDTCTWKAVPGGITRC